jgi:hypothetical protein
MEHQPIEQIPSLFPVLEQHQGEDAQQWDQVLHDHVHRQAKHLPFQEPAEYVRDHGQRQDGNQVLGLESEKRYSRS